MAITKTVNKSMDVVGINDPNWGNNVNNNTTLIDQIIGSSIAVAALTGTNIFTAAQIDNACMRFTGALTANSIYNLPTGVSGSFIIINATTGPWSLIIGSQDGGTTISVIQGSTSSIYISSLSGVGGAIFSDSPFVNTSLNSQVLYNSLGTLTGTSEFIFIDPNLSIGSKHSTITSTCSATTATITFLPNTKVIPIGSFISVTGVVPVEYNGNFLVTASSAGSVSYTVLTSGLGSQTTSGLINYGSITIGGDQIVVSAIDLNKVNAKYSSTDLAIQSDITAGTVGKLVDAAIFKANQFNLTLSTAQVTTSGTSKDFTGIPSWAKRVTMPIRGLSTNGSSNILIQLGTSGGFVTSGYDSSFQQASTGGAATAGFVVTTAIAAATVLNGSITLEHMGGNDWLQTGKLGTSTPSVTISGGGVSLGGVLDRVRITTVNGTDAFDAGSVNIMWE